MIEINQVDKKEYIKDKNSKRLLYRKDHKVVKFGGMDTYFVTGD